MSSVQDLQEKNAELTVTVAKLSGLVNSLHRVIDVLATAVSGATTGDEFQTDAKTALAALPEDLLSSPLAPQ